MNDLSEKTRLGLGILGAALVLGALGDATLRATPWALNVTVWTAALVIAAAGLIRWRRLPATGGGRWLVLPLLLFAAAFAWRDSPALKSLNGLALLVALALAAWRARAGRIRVAGVLDYTLGSVLVGLHLLLGPLLLLLGDVRWGELSRGSRWSRTLGAVGRGLLIAAPLLLLFGGLFVAADAVFEGFVADLLDWDIAEVFSHLLLTAVCAWAVAGLLRAALLMGEADGWRVPENQRAAPFGLGIIEIGVVLGLLNALFLAFVLVQLRYLFGGAAIVTASGGLTYAEYARRGFFELVLVTALVLPLLLLAHWLLRKENPRHERVFRTLAGSLVALLFAIMASAVQRMRLYQEAYGLTELRLYTTAFMGWLALVFGWYLATVLRGRRERFAFGALLAGFLVLALLDAANPDALIVRTNAARARAGVPFDARYAASLSADAAPALIEALPVMDERERPRVARRLLARWSPPANHDWRAWNWGRERAWAAVGAHRAELEALAR